jgi:hypothetical protein
MGELKRRRFWMLAGILAVLLIFSSFPVTAQPPGPPPPGTSDGPPPGPPDGPPGVETQEFEGAGPSPTPSGTVPATPAAPPGQRSLLDLLGGEGTSPQAGQAALDINGIYAG